MAGLFQCDIVSAETDIFSGAVEMLVASASEGDVGIYRGHAPLLTNLRPGPIRLKLANGEENIYYISGGYLEVQPNKVTVLADVALREGDMDEQAALEAKRVAEQALAGSSGDLDYARAAVQLAEASAQLRTLQALRRKTGKG